MREDYTGIHENIQTFIKIDRNELHILHALHKIIKFYWHYHEIQLFWLYLWNLK